MTASDALFESNLHGLQLIARGKVRDIYRVDAKRLLILASDRMSAFDVVLPDAIPGKGVVLTAISNFWFKKLEGVIKNHLTGVGTLGGAFRRERPGGGQGPRRRSPRLEGRCRWRPWCAAT